MATLARLQIFRPIQLLNDKAIKKSIIETHPDGMTSEWYSEVLFLCKSKDVKSLNAASVNYLMGKDSIYSISQLDKTFVDFHTKVKDKTILDPEVYIEWEKSMQSRVKGNQDYLKNIQGEFVRLADTSLALAISKNLGHKENLDYPSLLKSFHIFLKLFSDNKEKRSLDLKSTLDKFVVLPSCFFKLNKCTKKLEKFEIDKPFGHLQFGTISDDRSSKILPDVPTDNNNPSDNNPKDDCECKGCECDDCCQEQNPCCANLTPFISDLMIVKEELDCYEAKHLAYIETIMLGETRERKHRFLTKTEDYSETETTVTKSEEKDHQVSERFNLQTEIDKTIESDLSIDAGVTANAYGPGYNVTATLDVSSQVSKSESQRIAREQSVDITNRSVKKIEESVRELRSQRKINEIEEKNKHKFKNTTEDGGQKHINGMYQFVNMVSKGQVMNYGKRLMFEFVLPEPLELYKNIIKRSLNSQEIEKPKELVISPTDISDDPNNNNYFMKLVKNYNLESFEIPPEKQKIITFAINNDTLLSNADPAGSQLITIGTVPEGYITKQITTNFWVSEFPDADGSAEAMLFIAQGNIASGYQDSFQPSITEGETITGVLRFVYTCAVSGSGYVLCERLESLYKKWQLNIFNLIQDKYLNEVQIYETELAKYNAIKDLKPNFGRNPFLNREIERTELKRMAISYISCQFYDQFNAMKGKVEPCGFPEMDLEQAEKDGKYIQFFEQLFDWNLMTYLFYPYFWGRKCTWAEKTQIDSGDALFDKALMAGGARVQVPVKLGHEKLAIHWSTFGEIWNGSDEVPTPNSPYYISMAQEIKEQKGIFYQDREGVIQVNVNSTDIVLSNSSYYWDFDNNTVDEDKIELDINREIIIDCETYKIISITEDVSVAGHVQWLISIDKVFEATYQGQTVYNGPWSTGAVFVGAPFKIVLPTNLVYLKNKKVNGEYVTEDCLPCFPQAKCE
jgi:hypothetical protein